MMKIRQIIRQASAGAPTMKPFQSVRFRAAPLARSADAGDRRSGRPARMRQFAQRQIAAPSVGQPDR
jgi:hypothetical protein